MSAARAAGERVVCTPPESSGAASGRGRLAGRRVLVVGAGQESYGLADPPIGNGRAIAALAAREGAAVVCADRNAASASATAAQIAAEGGRAEVVAVDVSDPAAIEVMVAGATAALGGLDGVVYNVGIGAAHTLAAASAEAWDHVLAVNLRGAMLTARATLPVVSDGASIVFVSSVAGIRPGSRIPAYDASKAALDGLMRHVAMEGAPRWVRANIVAPGLMDTSLGRIASAGRPNRARTPVPLARQGTGWETAYAAVFLLSDEAAYVTGQKLVVDGGLSSIA